MSSFFRKVASAFVVMEEPSGAAAQAAQATPPETPASQALDDITKETGALLSQLEGRPTLPGIAEDAGEPATAIMGMTAEDVFRQGGFSDSPSSALRLLKLVAGLSMFPREQQLTMVRAMDAADDSWSEQEVVKDAKQRQAALQEHLKGIGAERALLDQALTAEIQSTRSNGELVLGELDKRIAELLARREQEAAETATAISKLEQKQRALEAQEQRARQGISQVIQALSGLTTFLGVPQGPEGR
jgi:hypothetical protein